MENIDIAATVELLLGIAILYFIAKSLLKSRSEKTVIGHVETPAPYKVEAPVTTPPVVESTPVVEVVEASATAKKPASKRAPAKKTAAKKAPAKKTVAKKTVSK